MHIFKSVKTYLVTAALLWTSCGEAPKLVPAPESEETRIVRALSQMNLTTTTQDSVTYRIEGKIDNALFASALEQLKALDAIHTLSLNFRGAPFTDLPALSELPNLQSLNLSSDDSLTSLAGFPNLSKLKTLNLSSNDNLTNLSGLPNLPGLHTLNLSSNRSLTDLSMLSNLTNLKTLDLSYNSSLKDLKNLPSISTLQTIDLSYCDAFSSLKSLPDLPGLRMLRLYNTAVTPGELDAFQKSRSGVAIDK